MGHVNVISKHIGSEEAGAFEQLLVEGKLLVLDS